MSNELLCLTKPFLFKNCCESLCIKKKKSIYSYTFYVIFRNMSTMFYGAHASIFRNAEKLRNNMTPTEKKLWEALSNNKLDGFRFKNQHPINKFIVDFYCHKARLVIELDGEVHNEREQADYDRGRTYEIESFGLRVIRFTNDQIEKHFEDVLKEIQKRLVEQSPLQGI